MSTGECDNNKKTDCNWNGEKNPVDNNAKEKSLYVMKGTKSESRRRNVDGLCTSGNDIDIETK